MTPDLTDLRVGSSVIYVDAVGVQCPAVVTAVWGKPEEVPCINLVVVSKDESKQDSYGRQIERNTSVVHKTRQPAHGWYYMMPGDTPNPVAPLQS